MREKSYWPVRTADQLQHICNSATFKSVNMHSYNGKQPASLAFFWNCNLTSLLNDPITNGQLYRSECLKTHCGHFWDTIMQTTFRGGLGCIWLLSFSSLYTNMNLFVAVLHNINISRHILIFLFLELRVPLPGAPFTLPSDSAPIRE